MAMPSRLIRWLLFALLAAAVGGALLLALLSLDTALSVWDRLQAMPKAFRYVYVMALSAAAIAIAWLGWRLLRKRRVRRPPIVASPITRERIDQRLERLQQTGDRPDAIDAELVELEARATSGVLYVAVFGAINAGKSALIRALASDADTASDVVGGTTARVSHHHGTLANGLSLILVDVPGTQEDPGRETIAREEVLRAHWVLYLCAGDLSRSEAADVSWLRSFGKPFALILNQADRYDASEQALLIDRLRTRLDVDVIAVSAGGDRLVEIATPEGIRHERRARVPDIKALQDLLTRRLAKGAVAFESARSQSVLSGIDQRLGHIESERRVAQSEQVISKYTRRAVVGALAAVAPGSDLVIQGALGTALVRELAGIHDMQVRQIDVDALIERAGRTLRTTTAVVLAIAGNAAKAFPGFGTIGGGLAHAVAYGMIFDSLGRAVADTLAAGDSLEGEAAQAAFGDRLRQAPASRLLGVVKSALGETVAGRSRKEEA